MRTELMIAPFKPIVYTVTELCDEQEAWAFTQTELLEEFGDWPRLNEAIDQALHYWGDTCDCGHFECTNQGYNSHEIIIPAIMPIRVQAHFELPLYVL